MNLQRHQVKAFTLIELLVVITIISLLAAIMFPVFAQAKEAAKKTNCISNGRQIGMAVRMYAGDYDDAMPIFYAYNSDPTKYTPNAHHGTEVLLFAYVKNKEIFKSPFDSGGPALATEVGGPYDTYWKAYGSSYRFTKCMYSVVEGESTGNNLPVTDANDLPYTKIVFDSNVEAPAETRIMRPEMFPFFSAKQDLACDYGYHCYNYYQTWSDKGGTLIYYDGHAKFIVSASQFDKSRVDAEGHVNRDPHPAAKFGNYYWACD